MSYSYNIVNSIVDYYEKNRLRYEFDEICATFSILVHIEDDKNINYIQHEIKITENGYFVHAIPDISVDVDKRHNMLRYINIINKKLSESSNQTFNFNFNLLSGELSFNKSVECGDVYLTDDDIDSITGFPDCNFYVFSEGIYNVMNNYNSPEVAANNSINKLEQIIQDSRNQNSKDSGSSFGGKELFCTKIAGTTFDGRQGIISDLKNRGMLNYGQSLLLQREYNNKYDSNAVQVLHSQSRQVLGYIPKDTVSRIAEKMDKGASFIAYVETVTGGNGYNLGINIKVCQEDIVSEDNDYTDYDDYKYDGYGDLNPYDLDAGDYEAWMDSFD